MIVHRSTFNRFDCRIGVPGDRAAYEPWANPNVADNGGGVFADGQACTASGIRRHSCCRRIRSWSSRGRILMFSDVWLAKQTRNAEKISFR